MAKQLVILAITAVHVAVATWQSDMKYKGLPQFKDYQFLGYLLFQQPARSTVECGRKCSQTDHCVVFTFVRSSGPALSTCRGHGDLDTSSLTSAPGAKSYTFVQDWLNRPCSNDADCKTKLPSNFVTTLGASSSPVCLQNLCLCYPGYFYSLGQKLCEQTCSNTDLQDSYTRYPCSGIGGHNDYVITGTVEECKAHCSSYTDCENFEIRTSGTAVRQTCNGARVSGYSVGFASPDYGWDHYQRDCI